MLLQIPNSPLANSPARVEWFARNPSVVKYFLIIYSITACLLATQFSWGEALFFLHLGLIVMVYEKFLPLFKIPLRHFPYFKSFVIAYVWSMATCYPAVKMSGASYWHCIHLFVFIWCLTMVFDMRDFSRDQQEKLKTLIALWGIKASKLLVVLVFFFNLILLHLFLIEDNVWVSVLTGFIFMFLVIKVRDDISDLYLIFGIDSLMVMKLLYLVK